GQPRSSQHWGHRGSGCVGFERRGTRGARPAGSGLRLTPNDADGRSHRVDVAQRRAPPSGERGPARGVQPGNGQAAYRPRPTLLRATFRVRARDLSRQGDQLVASKQRRSIPPEVPSVILRDRSGDDEATERIWQRLDEELPSLQLAGARRTSWVWAAAAAVLVFGSGVWVGSRAQAPTAEQNVMPHAEPDATD